MNTTIRRVVLATTLIGIFALGVTLGQNKFGQPQTVIHVVSLKWKADSTPAQQQAALDGVKTMAGKIPGIKNIWIRSTKTQGGTQEAPYKASFAIEFENEAAHKAYEGHPARAEWLKVYNVAREQSINQVITN
jgi:hypothetical protein